MKSRDTIDQVKRDQVPIRYNRGYPNIRFDQISQDLFGQTVIS